MGDHDLEDVGDTPINADTGFIHWQSVCHVRLDRVCTSSEVAQCMVSSRLTPVAFSNYAVVSVKFGKPQRRRKKSPWQSWKLNDDVLQDQNLIAQINETIAIKASNDVVNAVE